MSAPENEYENFDTAAAAADIGAELFSTGDNLGNGETVTEEVAEPTGTEPPAATETAPADPAPASTEPAVQPGQNSEPASLPKSWKREMAPEWEKASPALKAYVQERESQVMRGINQYAAAATNWDRLVTPFAPVLQQFPNVNPIELMQGLTATHLHLLSPSTAMADKVKIVTGLLGEYGITLDPNTGPNADTVLMQRIAKIEDANQRLVAETQRRAAEENQRGLETMSKQVADFSTDPKNKFFGEVGNDILRLIQIGAAPDLQTAYDQACWTNPAVRAKMLADQQAPAAAATPPRNQKNGQFVNLDADPGKARSKPISIDDTVDSIVSKHYSQAH